MFSMWDVQFLCHISFFFFFLSLNSKLFITHIKAQGMQNFEEENGIASAQWINEQSGISVTLPLSRST